MIETKPTTSKIKQFPTKQSEHVEKICEEINNNEQDEIVDINAALRAETLFSYNYAEGTNGLVKLQRRGKVLAHVPLLKAKIDVRSKRLICQVPDRIDQKPRQHGVVYDTTITSLADRDRCDELEIYLSDMLSQKPQFPQDIHCVALPHKRNLDDLIHAIRVIGELSPIEKRYDATGILKTNDGLIFLNPSNGALAHQGMNNQYHVQFPQHVAGKLTAIPYGWNRPSTKEEQIADFQTVLKILRIAPKSVGYGDILLALLGFCPFSQLCDTGGLWAIIHGLTGSMKSATSRLILQAYALVWGLQETSTINLREEASKIFAIEQVLYFLAGMFSHLDDGLKGNDISPQDIKKFWTMVSTIGGHNATRQGAKRGVWASGEGGFGIEPYPRGSGVITVETLPNSEAHASDLARFLTVSLDNIDCVDMALLTELQNEQSAKSMNRCTASYIMWLLPHMQNFLQTIPEKTEIYAKNNLHLRTVNSYAKAELAIEAFYQYGVHIGALTGIDAKKELENSRQRLVEAAIRQKYLMGIEEQKSQANNPVCIFDHSLRALMRNKKLCVSDKDYRKVTQFEGETVVGTINRLQPPKFLEEQDRIDAKPETYGWTWSEYNKLFETHAFEIGVLKQDGLNILLYSYTSDFKIAYEEIAKYALSQNTPLPGLNEMIQKLIDAGKLKKGKNATHLHGRGSRNERIYIYDMTPDKEPDETDGTEQSQEQIAPTQTEATQREMQPEKQTEQLKQPLQFGNLPPDRACIICKQSVWYFDGEKWACGNCNPAKQTQEETPINESTEYDYDAACLLYVELDQKGYELKYLENGQRTLKVKEGFTVLSSDEYEALRKRIIELDAPLRDIYKDRYPDTPPDNQPPDEPTPPNKPTKKSKSKEATYVDLSRGEGITLSGTSFNFPANCSLPELVQSLPVRQARVFLCGQLPENYEEWLLDAAMWEEYTTDTSKGQGHYLDPEKPTGHVGRYKHRSTDDSLEIRTMDAWLGETEYTVEQAREAVLLLNQYLQSAFTPDTTTYATPSQTFQQIWTRQNRLDGKKYDLLPQEVRDIIHSTSGQGRVELCTQEHIKKLKKLHYYDGVFMYAALTWGMPTELESHDHKNIYAGYKPARYRIRYTVPNNWQHIGLFMTPRDQENWMYPGDTSQGQTFEAWVDGSELDVLREHYESVEAGMQAWNIEILERIVFKSEKDSAIKKPLDSLTKKLVSMREQVEKDARLDTARQDIYKLVRGMVRNIVLHGIGAFHRDKRPITIILKDNDMAPENVIDIKPLEDGRIVYTVSGKIDEYSEQFDHPEWSALVWARCRARMTKHALSLPRESVIAVRTDAIATTKEVPEWKASEKVGTLREKWSIKKQLKAPRSLTELDALVEKNIKEGR